MRPHPRTGIGPLCAFVTLIAVACNVAPPREPGVEQTSSSSMASMKGYHFTHTPVFGDDPTTIGLPIRWLGVTLQDTSTSNAMQTYQSVLANGIESLPDGADIDYWFEVSSASPDGVAFVFYDDERFTCQIDLNGNIETTATMDSGETNGLYWQKGAVPLSELNLPTSIGRTATNELEFRVFDSAGALKADGGISHSLEAAN